MKLIEMQRPNLDKVKEQKLRIVSKEEIAKCFKERGEENRWVDLFGGKFWKLLDVKLFICVKEDEEQVDYECKPERMREFISEATGIIYHADWGKRRTNKPRLAYNESIYAICENPNCRGLQEIISIGREIDRIENQKKRYCMGCYSSEHSCSDCVEIDCPVRGMMENRGSLNVWGRNGNCLTKHNSSKEMRESSKKICETYMVPYRDQFMKETFYRTCAECDVECSVREVIRERGEYETKQNAFINNSCVTKMLPPEKRSKLASKQARINWQNPEYAAKIAKNLGSYLGNPDWAREVGKLGRAEIKRRLEEDPSYGMVLAKPLLDKLKNDPEGAKEDRSKGGRKVIQKILKENQDLIKDTVQSLGIEIETSHLDIKELDKLYEEIPGVWAIYGVEIESNEEHLLTVGQSINIVKEIRWSLRVLNNPKLQELEEKKPGSTGRWNLIQKLYTNYRYEIVCAGEEDFIKRETIEAVFALTNDAKYWRTSPFQNSLKFRETLESTLKDF